MDTPADASLDLPVRRPFIRFGYPTPTPSTDEILRLHIERRSYVPASGPYPGDRRRTQPPVGGRNVPAPDGKVDPCHSG